MSRWQKVLDRLLSGRSDANIAFDDIRGLLLRARFIESIRGDHHIFRRADIPEIINLQPLKNDKAKVYQVRQIRDILNRRGISRID